MSLLILVIIFSTSLLSGIFGMAGGSILIGVLSFALPISTAMILHGLVQMTSNGFRVLAFRSHVKWSLIPTYICGALCVLGIFFFFTLVPTKEFLLILIGIFPLVSLSVPNLPRLNIESRGTMLLAGGLVTAAQLFVGASGPILDAFFLKSSLNRFEIISTKAFTQVIGHSFKVVYYVILSQSIYELNSSIVIWIVPAITCAILGSYVGKAILTKLSERQFRKYSKIIISMIAVFFLYKGLSQIIGSA